MEDFKYKTFVGVVEDNNDPKKLGRCKVRVLNVFDEIPVEDIPWAAPWKDLNGNAFIVPDVGKIVSVVFDGGNIYKPEFIFAEHFNINLQKKLSQLSGSSYTSMRAVMFDHKTQIYSNDAEGLKIDYKFNSINITDGSIDLNIKDNFSGVNIGSRNADQQTILGNHFLNWFDEFVENLLSLKGGPYLVGGAPVLPNPEFVRCLSKYKELKEEKFLSHHVRVMDNNYANSPDFLSVFDATFTSDSQRVNIAQIGDSWTSTKSENVVSTDGVTTGGAPTSESVDYTPTDGNSTDKPVPESGDLTTSSDTLGTLNKNNIATDPGKIQPSNNKDVDRILNTMKKKKYAILSRPYEVNIVGIRRQYEGERYSNAFKDDLYLLFKTDDTDKWEIKKYPISTMPGYYQALEVNIPGEGLKLRTAGYELRPGETFVGKTSNGVAIDVKDTSVMQGRGGMGILKPAQYLDTYYINQFCGDKAMWTKGAQMFYKDSSKGPIIKYTSEGAGGAGMFIHAGYFQSYPSITVDNWSEGCQVFSKKVDLDDFFKWCEIHKSKYGDAFNYTLMLERDLESDGGIFGDLLAGIV